MVNGTWDLGNIREGKTIADDSRRTWISHSFYRVFYFYSFEASYGHIRLSPPILKCSYNSHDEVVGKVNISGNI